MKTKILYPLLCLSLAGCVVNPPIVHTMQSSYEQVEVAYAKKTGNNTIEGNAFMRQQGGGVVTCAGNEVFLVPVSHYAKERMAFLYNHESGGVASYYALMNKKFDKTDESYLADRRTTICNSDGRFTYKGIPDGEYYVGASVYWIVANAHQGGTMVRKIDVKGGGETEVILSN